MDNRGNSRARVSRARILLFVCAAFAKICGELRRRWICAKAAQKKCKILAREIPWTGIQRSSARTHNFAPFARPRGTTLVECPSADEPDVYNIYMYIYIYIHTYIYICLTFQLNFCAKAKRPSVSLPRGMRHAAARRDSQRQHGVKHIVFRRIKFLKQPIVIVWANNHFNNLHSKYHVETTHNLKL